MVNFTLKDLIIACNKNIISRKKFNDLLKKYVKNIYDQVSTNPELKNVLLNIRGNMDIDSIVERISLVSFNDPIDFYLATDKRNELNEIYQMGTNSYEVFHALETKVILGTVPNNCNKKITVSLGLETGTVFVNIVGKKIDRLNKEEPIVASYALADKDSVIQIEKRGKNYSEYSTVRNSIDNSVILSRFDPSHMHSYNTSGFYDNDNHPNMFDKIPQLNGEELELYQKYYKDVAPCPHFHYHQVDVNYIFGTNKYSFAININSLREYLNDLETAYYSKKKDPILNYDLGMPFLDIINNDIVCDMSDFISQTKDILKKYCNEQGNNNGITMLCDMIEKTRAKNSIGVLSKASDILCFVSQIFCKREFLLEDTSASIKNPEEREVAIAGLGNAFISATGNNIKVKKLLKNIDKDNDQDDDDEPKQ